MNLPKYLSGRGTVD